MRTIKFRAWDKERKVWWPLDSTDEIGILNDETFAVCQFTGLLDKNGKEIYEDDLLKDKFGDIYKANWKGCLYRQGKGSPMACDIPERIKENFEIIGNVWEHPHLLNHKGAV